MPSLGRFLTLALLGTVAACSTQVADESASNESNLGDDAEIREKRDTAPPDGPLAPDATFGINGTLTLTGPSNAISAARRADGSIGVLGGKDDGASLTIIKADGSAQADVALGGALDGVVLTHRDGLLVAGALDTGGRYFVARVNADGAIDPTFTPDPLDLRPSAGAAAVTKDGKVVLAGSFSDHAAIVRLNANGTLDASFGDQGLWLATDDRAKIANLALGADESIYAVSEGAGGKSLAHFSANGKPDASFTAESLPANAGLLAFTPSGVKYETGNVVGYSATTGFVTAVTDGDACTVHVTEKATTALTADECSKAVSYVALGGGKRAIVSNGAAGALVRVFSN